MKFNDIYCKNQGEITCIVTKNFPLFQFIIFDVKKTSLIEFKLLLSVDRKQIHRYRQGM